MGILGVVKESKIECECMVGAVCDDSSASLYCTVFIFRFEWIITWPVRFIPWIWTMTSDSNPFVFELFSIFHALCVSCKRWVISAVILNSIFYSDLTSKLFWKYGQFVSSASKTLLEDYGHFTLNIARCDPGCS